MVTFSYFIIVLDKLRSTPTANDLQMATNNPNLNWLNRWSIILFDFILLRVLIFWISLEIFSTYDLPAWALLDFT